MLESSFLFTEIHEQPQVLATMLAEELGAASELSAEIQRRQIDYVVIATAWDER